MIAHKTPWIFGGRMDPVARCRLFCLPHAGSGALQFCSWQKFLPPAVDICPIQLPARESRLRETGWTQVQAIVEALAAELEPYLDRPYILYGYSFGALVAFELARQLRRQQMAPPVSLYALARPAPHLPQTRSFLHQLSDDLLIREASRRFNGIPSAILEERDLIKLLLPALRADLTALETYVYREELPLECSIRVFGGSLDVTATETELEGWRQHTCGSFDLHLFQAEHFFIRSNLSAVLTAILADIPAESFWIN